jgi:hypothetical protein
LLPKLLGPYWWRRSKWGTAEEFFVTVDRRPFSFCRVRIDFDGYSDRVAFLASLVGKDDIEIVFKD